MQLRLPTGRIILGLMLALSLAIGGGAAVAAAAANNPSIAGGATLAAPVSTVHASGMRHGQGSGSGPIDQILCLLACMGLTAAPCLATPDVVLVLPSYVMQAHIAGCDAGDQVMISPTSPPPRANAAI